MVNGLIPVIVTDMSDGRTAQGLESFYIVVWPKLKDLTYTLFVILLRSLDVICLVIMMWSGGSMVLFLLKHKQWV